MADKKPKDYTADEIVKMVTAKRDSAAMQEMFTQMEADFALYSLEGYKPEPGHQGYISPAPFNDFNKVLYGVNKSSLTWQIQLPDDVPQIKRDAANKGEALLTGVNDRADRNLRNTGEPSLREGEAFFACIRGVIAEKCLLYSDKNKEQVIDIRPLDPLHMSWEKGAEGLVWAAHLYHVGKAEGKERWDLDLTDDEEPGTIVIDFFDCKINAVVLATSTAADMGRKEFVKKPTPHGLDHVPIYIGFAAQMPTVWRQDGTLALKQRAASVYAASRQVYDPQNKAISFIMDVAEKSVAGTLIYKTEDGKKDIEGDPFGAWQVVKLKIDEELKELMPAPVPAASSAIMSILERDHQMSTPPYPLAYGGESSPRSGVALAMENENTRSLYGPFTSLIADVTRWRCEEIFAQFKKKGQKMKLRGFDPKGKFFEMEASPDDIEDDWYINVKCEPKLPRDEAGELQMALAATQARPPTGEPLIDNYTAREQIMKLQNPDAIQTRIDEQMALQFAKSLKEYQIPKMADALIKAGDKEGAAALLALLPNPNQPGAGGPGGGPPGPGGPPMPSPPGPPMSPGAGGPPQGMPLQPQEIAKLVQIAQQMEANGQPIPDEIKAALMMALRQQEQGQNQANAAMQQPPGMTNPM